MEARTDRLDPELLELLHRAGLRSIEVGVESANQQTLRGNKRKAISRTQQESIIECCHKLGIRVIANYTLGLPNDTVDGIQETIRYAKKLNTFAIQFTVTTPYPGTQFYDTVRHDIFKKDWERFNGWTSVYNHAAVSSEELHRLREFAYVSYHSAHATSGDSSSQPSFTLSFFRSLKLRRNEYILKRTRRLRPIPDNTSSCGN